jgi:hypothetical protein
MTGQGKAVICSVGENTLLARMRQGEDFEIKESHTHLEQKLEITAKSIEKYALLIMAMTIITHLIFLIIYIPSTGEKLFSMKVLLQCA